MKTPPLYRILKKKESIGLLCNQSAWDPGKGRYRFAGLAETGRLKKIFVPEHGLFGELQDQVKQDEASVYTRLFPGVEWISLYGSGEQGLVARAEQLASIDLLVIDLQDVGSRYYTYISTVFLLLQQITRLGRELTVYVIDKPNPAGRIVEGTRLSEEYSSFIGLEGLPHRHGLTMGELCRYFQSLLAGNWELIVEPFRKKTQVGFIPPSPNIPTKATCELYSGQCLWEGTNISEGRGTTQPFAIFGAPFLNWIFGDEWNQKKHPAYSGNAQLRPLLFQPVFHKYSGRVCSGLHLTVLDPANYHSLAHSLQLIHYIRSRTTAFEWRPGPYEALNEKTAIELLAGDRVILDYLEDKASWQEIRNWLREEERAWIKEVSPFLLYKQPLQQLKIK